MKFNRRSLVLGASAGVLASPFIRLRPANAAEFTMKLANNQPLEHPTNIRAAEAVKAIAEQSDGRVDVQVFPSNQLGADTDVLSQLRAGGVEFFLLSPVILSTLVPNASINGIGFAFPDYDAVWKAMDGELGAYERGQIEDAGLVVMEKIWDNGFRQTTTSTKPIEGPADLEGFKIRVPVSPLWTSMFTAFGSAPTSINFAEVYTALQTGVVDGQENPLAIIKVAKMWEVQKYVSMTNHMWDGFWMLANRRAWGALPEDLQQIVAENFNKAGMDQRQDVMQLNADLRGELEGQGLVFNDV
ncbi:MAG TPA: TRAP transporter substrate-binding protein, partial [Paracoccus sp.]|nr:TRAP transporter substrate-binding protein [Paracoccus sp. (in: a-proteobacteria)]